VSAVSGSGCKLFLRFAAMAAVTQLLSIANAAAFDAYVARDSAVQTGPGADYPRVGTVARKASVQIKGCLEGFGWCDIASPDIRGWVMGRNLEYSTPGARVPLSQAWIRIPIVTYAQSP
jgi:uncharacterized protein YraI